MSDDLIRIRLAVDGVNEMLRDYERAEGATRRFGERTQAAGRQVQLSGQQMAQVSAQLQDLFVQIQAGGNPMTALLQQGSQLSGVFGGVGNALRAVGSLITPTVALLGGLAATVGAAAAAYAQGSAEADAYRKAIVLTGNAAGVTVGQLQDMARAQAALAGTQGRAAEVLAQMAASGNVAAAQLSAAADAAIRLERAGGPAAEETAKKFAKLGEDPVRALVELNKAENFLTEGVYKQVKALQEQGRTAEAASVAQTAYATAVADRAKSLEGGLGSLERGWRNLGDVAKSAWDKMLDVGRASTVEKEIDKIDQQIKRLRDSLAGKGLAGLEATKEAFYGGRSLQQQIADLETLRARLRDSIKLGADVANAERSRGEAVKATIKAEQDAAKTSRERSAQAERDIVLQERAIGLSGSYVKDLRELQSARQRGVLTEEQYIAAVQKVVAAQPVIVAGAKAQAEAEAAKARAVADAARAYDQQVEAQRRSAQSVADQVQKLRDEEQAAQLAANGNITLAEAIQQVAIARLEDAQARSLDIGEVDRLQREIDARRDLATLIGGKDLRAATEAANKELDKLFDPDKAQNFGDALSGAFAQAGSSLAKLSGALDAYGRTQTAIAERQAVVNAATDPAKKAREQLKLNEASQKSQVALYANLAGSAKGFFDEGTKGYKALEAAETAFRAYQLASDLQKGISAATVAVANQAQGDPYTAWARMAAMAAAMAALGYAVSGGFASGPTSGGDGRPVNTGTGTVFGDAEAQSESISRSIDRLADTASLQLSTQSGMLQALRSIEANIGGLSGLVLRGQATGGTAAERFGIREGTTVPGGALTSVIAGGIVGLADHLLFGGKVTQALFGKKVRVTGSGLFAGAQDLGSIVGNGLNLQDYADVNSTQRFLGIKVSNRNSTNYSAADPVLQQQFGLVFQGFYDAIKAASQPLDLALSDVTGRLDAFVVDIGKIELAGLTGEQINERLTAVLGAAGDRIAEAAIPGLQAFQVVGEGYFETLVRVASGIETAEAALDLLGITAINYGDIARKQGDVAAEIVRQSIAGFESLDGSLSSVGALITTLDGSAEDISSAYAALVDVRQVLIAVGASGDSLTASMIRGAGGLEALQGSLGTYFEEFFSADERAAAARAQLQGQFDRLGLGGLPATREAFRALVQAQDTTTEAGQKLYAQLLGLSGAFAELVPASAAAAESVDELAARMAQAAQRSLDQLASQRGGLEVALLRAQGDPTAAAARQRQLDLATLTAGTSPEQAAAIAAAYDYNRALEAQAASLTEAARASAAAASAEAQRIAAIASERGGLQQQIDQLTGNTGALRARELAALDESNRALQERIFALQDAAAAEAEAARLAEEAAQRIAAIANERAGLERQMLQLQGNTAALRALELAGLDASNRSLLERIYALQDAAEAEAEAAQAAQQAAQQAQAIASERAGLEQRILQLQGNTTALRALELAGLDASNRALQERIYALQDAAEAEALAARQAEEAQRASEQIRGAWQSVTDTLFDEVARIRGLLTGGPGGLTLAQAQAQFAIATGQARAGDQDAARALPGLSQTLLELATANAGSLLELNRIRAAIAASLEQTGSGLAGRFGLAVPKLATGTNLVPRDMLALLHEGEAVVPRAFNPAANGASSTEVVKEIRLLLDAIQAGDLATVRQIGELLRIVKTWDGNGLPEERSTA